MHTAPSGIASGVAEMATKNITTAHTKPSRPTESKSEYKPKKSNSKTRETRNSNSVSMLCFLKILYALVRSQCRARANHDTERLRRRSSASIKLPICIVLRCNDCSHQCASKLRLAWSSEKCRGIHKKAWSLHRRPLHHVKALALPCLSERATPEPPRRCTLCRANTLQQRKRHTAGLTHHQTQCITWASTVALI